MSIIHGKYVLTYQEQNFLSLEELEAQVDDKANLIATSISVKEGLIQISLVDYLVLTNDLSEKWVEEYVKQFGSAPSFF